MSELEAAADQILGLCLLGIPGGASLAALLYATFTWSIRMGRDDRGGNHG